MKDKILKKDKMELKNMLSEVTQSQRKCQSSYSYVNLSIWFFDLYM